MNEDPVPLSGVQHVLRAGDLEATVAGVGATLRALTFRGRDLVVPFEADELRPDFRGAILAPWPNRVVDGRYAFDGADQQLALTEPARSHAIHGLAGWLHCEAIQASESSVTLAEVVEPQAGYPHRLLIAVDYALDPEGLTITVVTTNLGTSAAPYGTGPHPYLVAGPLPIDEWTMHLPAEQVLTVTPDRLIPVSLAPVETEQGGTFDFRTPRPIGTVAIDHAFTGLVWSEEQAAVTLLAPDGNGVRMLWDAASPWVQVHTADRPNPATNRLGVAVEPMTCPPDAFNSGTDLIVLDPGTSHQVRWRIEPVGA